MSIADDLQGISGGLQSPSVSAEGNAQLGPAGSSGGAGYVPFQYNPAEIVVSHTAPMAPSAGRTPKGDKGGGSGTTTTSGPSVSVAATNVAEGLAVANGFTTINVHSVTFDGPSVKQYCDQLLDWTSLKDMVSGTTRTKLPQLMFRWGPSQNYLVELTKVTIKYTRFSQTGTPVRALVDLMMHSIPDVPRATNPTSGGLAGRRSHLLTGAETLPELATRYYGDPGGWRQIAAANGVEDPLRVRPGTRVYLPSTQETGR
jgi:nucleoid-associated protein YgaU